MANAQFAARQQMQDPEARLIAQALINLNKAHVQHLLAVVVAHAEPMPHASFARQSVCFRASWNLSSFPSAWNPLTVYCDMTQPSYSTSTSSSSDGIKDRARSIIFASFPAVRR